MKAGKAGATVRMSNFQARTLTGLLLGLLVLGVSWIGGWQFSLFSILAGGAVFYEWGRLTLPLQSTMTRTCGWVCYAAVGAALFFRFPAWCIFLVLLAGFVLLAFLAARNAGWVAGGFLYAALFAVTLGLLRGHDGAGLISVCFLYAVVWGTDVGAYFSGRAFGGPKLAPALSPGKTWSGAAGGAVIGVGGGLCVALPVIGASQAIGAVFVLALLLSVVSQIGDLAESWIKRRFHVKDSGNILPGHGGVMDRVDGLITASFALYVIGAFSAGADVPSNLFYCL